MLICVLKTSSFLTLCLESTSPNRSKISVMTTKMPMSCWIKTNLGIEPLMQTEAKVEVVQVFDGHPFEGEVQPTVPF